MGYPKYIPHLNANRAIFGTFDSDLVVPDGSEGDPSLNASLTLRLRVRLFLADAVYYVPGVIRRSGSDYSATDSDHRDYNICNWDASSARDCRERFLKGETHWDHRFVLITPVNCDVLDYDCSVGAGWHVRPNVVCRFQLSIDPVNYHRIVNVVRLDPTAWENFEASFGRPLFRAHSTLLAYPDSLYSNTLCHELGHLLREPHIMGLYGIPICQLGAPDADQEYCYGEGADADNIMGSGKDLNVLNGLPWLKRIENHTGVSAVQWGISMERTPARKVPLGVMQVGPPTYF
jgi:hypothetical protein